MGTKDPRIDAYIAKAPDFARPILTHIRAEVHRACPEVEETLKWSSPHFLYKGEMMCGMAAFKQHCAMGFWKGSLVVGDKDNKNGEAAGQMGRLTSIRDLPSKPTLKGYIKKAMQLNDTGVKVPRMKGAPKKPLPTPPDLAKALKTSKKALATFEAFSPSHRREYIEWITEAKTEETRTRRLKTAIEWMAEGKSRMWKYHS